MPLTALFWRSSPTRTATRTHLTRSFTAKGKKRKTGDDDSIDDGEAAGDGDGGTAAAKRPKSGVGSPTKPGRGRGGGTRGGPRGGA